MSRIGKAATHAVAAPAQAMADDICKIEYLGGADAMVVPDTDMFEHFGTMMPGDENSGIVDIRNSGSKTAQLWFWAEEEVRAGSDTEEDLLNEIVLEIVDLATGESVYAGSLHPDGMTEPILLGIYEPGQSAELAYNILVPGYLGNDYMDAETGVTWTFAAEEVSEGGDAAQGDGTHLGNTGSFFAKTGVDVTGLLGLSGALVAVGAGGAYIVGARKRREDETA